MERHLFYKSQYPVLLVTRILGLTPFSIKITETKTVLQLSLPWLVYSIILFVGYLFAFATCLPVSYIIPLIRNYPFISVIGHLFHIILGAIIFIVLNTLNFLKSKEISDIGDMMCVVDDEIIKLTFPVKDVLDYRRSMKVKVILFGSNMSFFIFMFVFDYFVFEDLYGSYIFLMCFTYILPYFSSSATMMVFMNMTAYVYERLQVLNRLLEHIATTNENYIKQGEPPQPGKEKEKKLSAEKKKSFLDSQKFDPDLHMKLNDIFRVHDMLCDVAEKINDLYSFQLVICITCIFILVLFGFFFETKVVFWAWGGAIKLMLISTSYLLWGIIASFIVYMMLYLCSHTRDEANKSALIIHKILQMKPAFMLNDEVYYNKMKSFTLQVLHRKNIMHFNGLGLFRLDYTFIFSAVSAATSYLIVLLQFDMSNELKAFSSAKFY